MKTAGDQARYDEYAKILLSNRAVLARILKLAVPEYKDEPLDAIEGYIHDGVQVGVAATDANTSDLESRTVGHRILPLAQESNDMRNGVVTFDVLFRADLPKARGKQMCVFVNIEPQLIFNPDYPVSSRSVYYLARQISLQKGTVFEGEDYGSIQKCYSIWICPDTKKKRSSFVSVLEFTKKDIYGTCRFHRSSYDKMAAIFCSFQPGEERNELLRFLDTLFSKEKSLEERRRILEEDYGIRDEELEGTMKDMCNLGEGIYLDGQDNALSFLAKLWNEGKEEEVRKMLSDVKYGKKVLAEERAKEKAVMA